MSVRLARVAAAREALSAAASSACDPLMPKRSLTPNEQRAAASLSRLDTGTLRLTLAGSYDSKPKLAQLIHAELEMRKAKASSSPLAGASIFPNEKAPVSPGASVLESTQARTIQENGERIAPPGCLDASAKGEAR
jgi:hypothetical protein